MKINDISELSYKYIFAMSKTKKYNPQTIANINVLSNYGLKGIKQVMNQDVIEFCKNHKLNKSRDFVYKSDHFTPRNMHLINPLFYTYYTCIVFKIACLFLKGESKLDFSSERMKIFYSGVLDIHSTKEIEKNAKFNKSYRSFQKERERYFGFPVLKLDLQDFFNSIKIKLLISKLRSHLGDREIINDLEYFFDFCGFEHLPQLHYSIASSILSQFYLLDFDESMNKILEKDDLFLIRFVDDMFIIHLDGKINNKKVNNLLNEISHFLWKDELVLNSSKTKLLSPDEYKSAFELMVQNYDSGEISFSSEKIIEAKTDEILNNGYLIYLIEELCKLEKSEGIDLKKYKTLTTKYISIDGEDSRKVLNNIIFSKKWKGLSDKDLMKLIENWKYILFNPSQFTVLYILVCRHLEYNKVINGTKIKRVLRYLYNNKNNTFRDTLVAISYLFQNKNNNRELLDKVEHVNHDYVDFIKSFI
ncbi:RNA-directed DNA polymerase [Paenibacillus nitricinens]|uniref:RNA-directed DNA polymerase n=1 Tax=Paenibacillus nitricinens TaxID=3367691 RepID=UPI003F82CA50